MQSVVLVVTCWESDRLSKENTLLKLKGLSETTASDFPNMSKLLALIYQKNKVLMFKAPPEVGEYKRSEGPEMLKNILSLTTEWTRKSQNSTTVSLSNLDFTHIMRTLQRDQKAQASQFSEDMNKWAIIICELIERPISKILLKVVNKPPIAA